MREDLESQNLGLFVAPFAERRIVDVVSSLTYFFGDLSEQTCNHVGIMSM